MKQAKKSRRSLRQESILTESALMSDAEIWAKLEKSFKVLEILTKAAIDGQCRSLIVYGPAGLGKSYTVEKCLESSGVNHAIIKGGSTKIGLLKTLYQYRNKGDVVVFDDCELGQVRCH